jgi:hypothetical protein
MLRATGSVSLMDSLQYYQLQVFTFLYFLGFSFPTMLITLCYFQY